MNTRFNYKAVTLARESRGITQTELSKLTELPQSSISKIEQDLFKNLDDETIEKLSKALNYPKDFFFQELSIYPPNLHYRKRADIPMYLKNMAEASMNIYRINIQKLLQSIELPENKIPEISLTHGINTPSDAARYLRNYWGIEKGRIDDLTKIIEGKGAIVILTDYGTEKIDGKSMVTENGVYLIFLNKSLSGDRQRFTLAHELGHLVLHLHLFDAFDVDIEAEANLFASEFLMPEHEIKGQFGGGKLTIAKLADLKKYWKTSMASLLVRAQQIGATTQNHARYLWMQFNTMGIKRKEPIEIPNENPSLLKDIIAAHLGSELNYSKEDLAKILCLNMDDFDSKYSFNERKIIPLRVA